MGASERVMADPLSSASASRPRDPGLRTTVLTIIHATRMSQRVEQDEAGQRRRVRTGEEAAFLAGWDSRISPSPEPPSFTVDVAILTIVDDAVHVLLVERTKPPATGR